MSSYIDQVQRGIDHIEANLERSFPLTDVSRAAAMSHWHFQRMFRALTGETLGAYVRERRLSRSASRLLETDVRILDIAIDAGFESHESFTRAFKRSYGLPPAEYRRLGARRLFPEKVRIDETYLAHLADGVSRQPDLVERSPQTVAGMRTAFFGIDSEKNNLADKIPPLWDAFLPRLDELDRPRPDVAFGVITATIGSESLAYLACCETVGTPPPDMDQATVPGGTWAVFEHRGPTSSLDHTVSYIYSTWLAGSAEWRHTYGPDLEIYGPEWDATAPTSRMHYAIPVRRAPE